MENIITNENIIEEVIGENSEVVVEVVKKSSFGRNALIVAALAGVGIAAVKVVKKVRDKKANEKKDYTKFFENAVIK